MNNPRYRHVDRLLTQRAMPLARGGSVVAALADPALRFPPGEVAGLVSRRGGVTSFNLVAAFVWDLIDGRRTPDELVAAVVARFTVDESRARADVLRLLGDLERRGLILVDDPPSTQDED